MRQLKMKSCIYKGLVKHARLAPGPHEFTYSLFMMYVDLEELPYLFKKNRFWKINKPGIAAFHRKDHYGDTNKTLIDEIKTLVKNEKNIEIDGPIRLLTHFRYFGYIFNPLCLYFCFNKAETEIVSIVAEVMNTPWRERHCYVIPNLNSNQERITYTHSKAFHVSPFMQMDMKYKWSIQSPENNLSINIENWQDNTKVFDANMWLERTELNKKNLLKALLNFPLMTLKVTSAIYFEALKLWIKGNKYIPHPKSQ